MSYVKILSSRVTFLCICVLLLLAVTSQSQSTTGTISGVVTDTNGGVVPGASVALINEQNRAMRTAVSNDEGRFSFASVQPGKPRSTGEMPQNERCNKMPENIDW